MLKVYPYKERASHNDQTNMKSTSCQFAIGLDYGTNSVRAVIVDLADGTEVTNTVHDYPSGDEGVLLDPTDPNLARQNPADYIEGFCRSVGAAVRAAKKHRGFKPENVVGIGVDTTGSTPIPVDAEGTPLAAQRRFEKNLAAHAWLWKDHTSAAAATYARLYPLYRRLHDAFGVPGSQDPVGEVTKELIAIRNQVRQGEA